MIETLTHSTHRLVKPIETKEGIRLFSIMRHNFLTNVVDQCIMQSPTGDLFVETQTAVDS